VLLESTHRIERLLEQMQQVMPELLIVLAKELTKQHERFIRGTPEQCLQQLATDKSLIKGEFVVLFHVADKDGAQTRGMDEQQVLSLLLNELPLKKAVKLTVALTGGNKNDLYRLALRLSGKQP
jgi:16S rRNA (cytidine1402-2'-O)-methyltransferase